MQKEMLFDSGRYFAQCHASTVLPLPNGDVLCAYFAGTHEKHPDVGIWLSRRVDGIWEKPVCISKTEQTAHWNPVLFFEDEQKTVIRIVYKVSKEIENWKNRTRVSYDNGLTWSEECCYKGTCADCGPVRSKPLRLPDGSLLAPDSTEYGRVWRPRVVRSVNGGASFDFFADIPLNCDRPEEPGYISGAGAIQPALWLDPQNQVHAFLRTTAGKIFRSDSKDGGKTWCEAYDSGLANNNSGIETAQHNGDLYLICNPVGENWGARYPLDVLKSTDNGQTFSLFARLEETPTQEEKAAFIALGSEKAGWPGHIEYSYPAAVVYDDCLYITYTYRRCQIAFWKLPL